jgi:hypothetical protein
MKTMRTRKLLALLAVSLFGCQPPPAVPPDDGAAAPEPVAEAPSEEPTAEEQPKADEVDQSNLPAAEQVFARSVEAVGGQAKIDAIKTFYQETVLDIPSQNMSARTKVWWKTGQFYAETDMPAIGVTRMWKTDKGLWADDPVNGMREVTGPEARQTAWSNSLVLSAEWQKYFEKAETTGRRKAGDKTVVDVKLSNASGDEVTLSFDEATGLLAEQSFTQQSPMGEVPIVVRVDEYKDYDGFKSPVKSMMDMKVIQATQEVVKFEPNAKVDAKKLVPPKNKKGKKTAAPKAAPKAEAAPKASAKEAAPK